MGLRPAVGNATKETVKELVRNEKWTSFWRGGLHKIVYVVCGKHIEKKPEVW